MSDNERDSDIEALIELLESRKSDNETKPVPQEVNLAEQIKNALKHAEGNDVEGAKDEIAKAGNTLTMLSLIIKLMDSPISKVLIAAIVAVCGFKASTTDSSITQIKNNETLTVATSKNLNSQVNYLTQLVQKLYTNGKLRDGEVEKLSLELARLENMNSLLLTKLNAEDAEITLDELANAGITESFTINQSAEASFAPVPIIKISKPIKTTRMAADINEEALFKKINDSSKINEKALQQLKYVAPIVTK